VLGWKLRLLNAEALNRQADKPKQSLALLATAPANLPSELLADINIAKSYPLCSLQRPAEAAVLLDQTDALIGQSRQLHARLIYAKGVCASYINSDQATEYFKNAAKIAHGTDGYLEARALVYLGYLLMQERHYDQAIEYLNQALDATTSLLLKQMAFGNLGECHAELGDWEGAINYSQAAEEAASGIRDASKDRVRWLIDLGRIYYSQIQYGDAEKSWVNALGIAGDTRDADLKARCLNNLAGLALAQGDKVHAQDYIAQADDLHLPGTQRQYLLLHKAELEQLRGNYLQAKRFLSAILQGKPDPQIKYEAETDLANLYVTQNHSREAERMFRAGITTEEQAFSRITNDQFRISFSDYIPVYDRYIHFLIDQNRPLEALKIAEHGRSPALRVALGFSNSALEIDLHKIQRRIRTAHQVVLAYWLSPGQSYIWIITPSDMKLAKLPPEMEIVGAVDAYSREVLQAGAARDSMLGQKLYDILVAPAEKYIPKGATVIIVPHRRLYKLNFETLVSPRPEPHYWIEDVCIQNASFLALLETSRQIQTRYAKELLLMGAPIQANKDFPGLTHAPDEVAKVAAHFPHSEETVKDGAAATPAAYDSSDPGEYRFLHFVTHGTASDANPLESAIILSPSNRGYKLYARDIIKTRIHPQLVTISACYGAGTRQYSGEGLVGLAWAFLRVGAHQVVAALWEVDDAATADLMDRFYSELTKGKTAAQALRNSKLSMLHSKGPRKRPFYWGSLQLYTGR
jgi:CHAT domain-containing protein/tetratricopeptide (TPR) repeat protein